MAAGALAAATPGASAPPQTDTDGRRISFANPGVRSNDARAYLPIFELMSAVYGGTETMRQEGERFLPREISESPKRYAHRLAGTTAFNKLKEAVDSASAKPFKNLLSLNGADPEFDGWMKDADLEGHHLHLVGHRFFNEAVLKSRAHILVDHPSTLKLRNLAEQRSRKIRPFMRLIRPEDLLAAYYERRGGDQICVHARIAAQRIAFDRETFRETTYDQVFVIEPGVVQLWERPRLVLSGADGAYAISGLGAGGSIVSANPLPTQYQAMTLGGAGGGSPGGYWTLADESSFNIDEVPLVTMTTGERPIFQDLAYKQIEHWRSSSEQRNILAAARFPMLACSGVNLDTETGPEGTPAFEIGPWKIMVSPDPNGRWYFIETKGTALEAGHRDIEAIEVQMEQLSLNPIVNQPGRQYIAQNERSITEARVNTVVHDLAITCRDSLERAIDFMAKWSGRDPGKIGLNMNFDFSGVDQLAKSITEITGMLAVGSITPEGAIPELVRLNLLSDQFDVPGEVARLKDRLAQEQASKAQPQDFTDKPGATRPDKQG